MNVGAKSERTYLATFAVCVLAVGCLAALPIDTPTALDPATMHAIASVDRRFQSYNIEMLEVTGGRFWKPYKDMQNAPPENRDKGSTPTGMNPNMYEYRPPINLADKRLRKLADALGPAYVRVSGTWANTTYFADSADSGPATPPKGFNGVLTREQWKGVVNFAHAADAEIITSVPIGPGTRDAAGVWNPDQARALYSYTNTVGGRIAATEFMNEPNIALMGGAPRGYNPAAYARDIEVFRNFLKQTSPNTLLLGPGSVAESGSSAPPPGMGMLLSKDLLKAAGPVFDVFSYHLYPAVSQRCAGMGANMGTTAADALSGQWLARPDAINAYYMNLRNQFDPGKPIWITETADAACGGNPWASTFLDTFRFVDEHGRLAQQGVSVIVHNTLAASDYGLLDGQTFTPRPNYWAAVLWQKLMGTTVLKPNTTEAADLHTYAHCMSGVPGGVAIVVINTNRSSPQKLTVSSASERYTLTAPKLEETRVELNGTSLKLRDDDSLPQFTGLLTASGSITLPPASITFLAVGGAHNVSCQ